MRPGVVLLAILGLVHCTSGPSSETVEPTRVLRGVGLSIELPLAWDGRIYENDTGLRIVQAASVGLVRGDDDVGSKTIQRLGSDDVIVAIWYWPEQTDAPDSGALPLQIGRSNFGDFECYADPPAPETAMRMAITDAHLLQTVVFFGSESPSDDAIAQANRVLESLTIR